MSPLLCCLLLVVLFDPSRAYNMYKDLQRGKVEDLERLITDESHTVDQSDQTWPSVGARLQASNSDKRTMSRFKSLKTTSNVDTEDSNHEKDNTEVDGPVEDSVVGARFMIPRTHVLLRDGEVKFKRGPLFLDLGLAPNRELLRNMIRIFKLLPQKALDDLSSLPEMFPDRCRKYQDYYRCD